MSTENVTRIETGSGRTVIVNEIVEKLQYPTQLAAFVANHHGNIAYDKGLSLAHYEHEGDVFPAVELKLQVEKDRSEPIFSIRTGYDTSECVYEKEFANAFGIFLQAVDLFAVESKG